MSSIPKKIGKYGVIKVAGKGAMGTVYVGHDPFIDRNVAIKVCTLEEDDEIAALARRMFFNEAQAAGALDHPNIVRVYDAGEENGEPYIVMEYIEGADDLQSYTKPNNLLPLEKVVEYMHQAAKALDYAHRRKVLHRDIKPANIMLTRDGEAKLADFGIAQRIHSEKTQLVAGFGSPRYMSPEQVEEKTLTHHTDIYSLGVTAYELIAGRTPFAAKTIARLLTMIVTEEAPPISELRPEVPAALAAIVEKAMKKPIDERYQSGAEMAADLAGLHERLGHVEEIELSEEEKFKLARELKFFNEFSDDELEEVLAVAEWEGYEDGHKLINEGESDRSFFILASGDADIVVGGRTISALTKGECAGELGYLSESNRIASVVARGDVLAMRIDDMHMEWASLPCQLRFNKELQRVLIERLSATTLELARRM